MQADEVTVVGAVISQLTQNVQKTKKEKKKKKEKEEIEYKNDLVRNASTVKRQGKNWSLYKIKK